ncbi:MAG: hypothetical protein IJT73_07170 [Selenomonadaceae bacterium]|nr:hypothetical protein [Selenomonadaceae bacterium]
MKRAQLLKLCKNLPNVPENLKSTETIDFSDAVFGLKENWASRVLEGEVSDSLRRRT